MRNEGNPIPPSETGRHRKPSRVPLRYTGILVLAVLAVFCVGTTPLTTPPPRAAPLLLHLPLPLPVPASAGTVSSSDVDRTISLVAPVASAARTMAALGAQQVQSELRSAQGGSVERWTLWHSTSADTPWVATREPLESKDPEGNSAWVAWAADRVVISSQASALGPDAALGATNGTAVALNVVRSLGLVPTRRTAFSPVWRVNLAMPSPPSLGAVDDAIAQLAARLPAGQHVQRDTLLWPARTPNDPRFPDQWSLPRVRAPEAWDLGTGTTAVTIAFFDTGIDLGHADLAPNLFINPGEAGLRAQNGIDDDGNGLIDDGYGWDFEQGDAEPQDTSGHGTAVAGAAGAVGDNANGVAGAAWTVRLLPLRVGAGFFSVSNLAQAIDYVIDLRARHGLQIAALNFSLGGRLTDTTPDGAVGDLFYAALTRARAADLLVVAAAGNEATNLETTAYYPASYRLDNVIAVVGSARPDAQSRDPLASFSNFGALSADLAAPAADVRTTLLGGGNGAVSGTSFAAPLVSGALALAAAQSQPFPAATWREMLLATVDAQEPLAGRCVTGGRLNIRDLAQAARLQAWKHTYFGPPDTGSGAGDEGTENPAASANEADPDGDGSPNLAEFLRGTSPVNILGEGATDRGDTFALAAANGVPAYEFTYWRARAAAHVPRVLETTTDPTNVAWGMAVPFDQTVIETRTDGTQRIRVRVARSSEEPLRFFRFRLTAPL